MTQRNVLRDIAMLLIAGLIGWWAHGANTPVRAAGTSADAAHNNSNLSFQFGGAGLEGSLTLYNPENKTLYVYPGAIGSAHINCVYSIHVEKPGAPLERQNCATGSDFSR